MGKAWQAFERSAKKVGFFDAGLDHLVRPRTEAHQTVPSPQLKKALTVRMMTANSVAAMTGRAVAIWEVGVVDTTP